MIFYELRQKLKFGVSIKTLPYKNAPLLKRFTTKTLNSLLFWIDFSSGYIYGSIFQSKHVSDIVFDLSNEGSYSPSITETNLLKIIMINFHFLNKTI